MPLVMTPGSCPHLAHSMNEETEVQRGEGACLWLKAEWGLEPETIT